MAYIDFLPSLFVLFDLPMNCIYLISIYNHNQIVRGDIYLIPFWYHVIYPVVSMYNLLSSFNSVCVKSSLSQNVHSCEQIALNSQFKFLNCSTKGLSSSNLALIDYICSKYAKFVLSTS